MSWLTEFVRPKIQKLVRRSEVPENLWHKCPSCEQMIFHRDLAKNNHVCQHCGHHMRISARDRLELMFDSGKYQTIELPSVPVDPLRFRDQKKYVDRLKTAQAKAEFKDALAVAHGTVGGHATVIAVFDFSFMGGSMGTAVGEGIVAAAELAVVQDAALIVVPASGGARMQEGILSLMQMARTTAAIEKVKEKGLPYFVLLTDPTTGGVSASFAMLGDIQIAEPGAQIGFAGRRVIENTIREKLPDNFQTAEYLLEHGMVDMVTPRSELNATFGRLIDMIRRPKPGASVVPIKDGKKAGGKDKTPTAEKAD
ncbi:acetyl-CoA carboxylase, carboxyltransferase subunit beta [Thalassospira sp. MCCC 1A01428]|uniref:acetyl-CoA carboxylase, carboxyltransferase subunit beta n=1 Tax=Thalassospira sp. MCCC 1A01428 TaxID=1470575 RepID=UPI000A1E1B6F|nr:acetyl-CoA carboxylase, carboxyltransferase subunit beta [Thalassospira sp. MCCC 1A01428]OSQ41759.1 acetyl-CoA carboxyl transferase [Thalassospira sp. MCCC 1A01428]